MLRTLDLRGYTSREGFRGRFLTPLGLGRLDELRRERQRTSTSKELMNLLRASQRDDLIDILVARRAIERETARLAALNARQEDLRELAEVVGLAPGSDGGEDVRFHKLIARASGNRVLEAAVDLIRQDAQLSPVLVHIRQQVQSTLVSEHRRILRAIQSRDPVAAETAMVDHLENLIRDVRKYWGRVEPSSNIAES
jgi:GntR family L-lactate dehydrogenase operon transcriptional regulator